MNKKLKEFVAISGMMMSAGNALAMTPEELGEVPTQQQMRGIVWMTPDGSRALTKRDMQQKPVPEKVNYKVPVTNTVREGKALLTKTELVDAEQTVTPQFSAANDEVIFAGGRIPSTLWDNGAISLAYQGKTDVSELTFNSPAMMTSSYYEVGTDGLGKLFTFGFNWNFGESDDTNVNAYGYGGTTTGGSVGNITTSSEGGDAASSSEVGNIDIKNKNEQSQNQEQQQKQLQLQKQQQQQEQQQKAQALAIAKAKAEAEAKAKAEKEKEHGNNGHNGGGCQKQDQHGNDTCLFIKKTGVLVTSVKGEFTASRPGLLAPRATPTTPKVA